MVRGPEPDVFEAARPFAADRRVLDLTKIEPLREGGDEVSRLSTCRGPTRFRPNKSPLGFGRGEVSRLSTWYDWMR